LSEHGDVTEAQPRVLYLYDMHTNMHTTQRLFPKRIWQSRPLPQHNVWAVCIHNFTRRWNQTRALPLRMRKTSSELI